MFPPDNAACGDDKSNSAAPLKSSPTLRTYPRACDYGSRATLLRYLAGGFPSAFLNMVMKAVTDS